jgi:hypothetical protein
MPAASSWNAWRGAMVVRGLEPGQSYRAFYFDPRTGREYPLGTVQATAEGHYTLPKPPIFQDWVVVLERNQTA